MFELGKQLGEIGFGVHPGKGLGGGFPVVLKFEEALGELAKAGEVVGRENFSLDDGEVDLDLIQPTGMNRSVNENQPGELLLEAEDGGVAAVGTAVIDDPEDATGFVVGRPGHDLLDEVEEGVDAGGGLATAKDPSMVDVESGEVGPGTAALVFVLDAHEAMGSRRQGRMCATTGLHAGLLIGGDDKFVAFEGFVLPRAAIQVEDAVGPDGKIGVARKDPTALIPRANGVLVEPAPDGASRDAGHQAGVADLASDVGSIPVRQWQVEGGGQLASQRFDLYDQLRGEKPGGDPGERARRGRRGAPRRTVFATS